MKRDSRERWNSLVRCFSIGVVIMLIAAAQAALCQDLPPTYSTMTTIPTGSYVIPMDNVNQAVGTPFNIKAYGLANRLLQNNIPLYWVIKAGKAKDDADFSVMAKRIKPSSLATASRTFSGGPLVVLPQYRDQALAFINAFGNNVAVFETTAAVDVPVRYVLSHKPLIAVGSVNSAIHTDLLDYALIPNYVAVTDTTVNAGTCVTLVTQAHTEDPRAITNIKAFVQSGGNFLAQCAAVNTYENIVPLGQFQTNRGYVIDNVDTDLTYPNGDMPYSQFIGALRSKPGGREQDWMLSNSNFINNTFIAAQNSGAYTDHYAATISKLFYAGKGGMVAYLGGHEYATGGNDVEVINGQRMLLNMVLQPPSRPTACNIDLTSPVVYGHKLVTIHDDYINIGEVNPGDTILWEIIYVNTGDGAANNFQINEALPSGVTMIGSPTIELFGTGTSASINPIYNGTGTNDLLASGAALGPAGAIHVSIIASINWDSIGHIANQASATSTSYPGSVMTDSLDQTMPMEPNAGLNPCVVMGPDKCIDQDPHHTDGIDPTYFEVMLYPTAAMVSISGRVTLENGTGVPGALLTLTELSTGNVLTARTSPFGYYSFSDLPVGETYVLTVNRKGLTIANNPLNFTLMEELIDLDFTAVPATAARSR
jgi:uncharacterized repeat protein (TIGR01451 family)